MYKNLVFVKAFFKFRKKMFQKFDFVIENLKRNFTHGPQEILGWAA
jgi:hypothetical protein